jgi:hypothetical protein
MYWITIWFANHYTVTSNPLKLRIKHDGKWKHRAWVLTCLLPLTYQRESVNVSQMDIKRKTCDIRSWGKSTYFSTYPPPTLIHLSHRVETRSIKSLIDCCLSHFRTSVLSSTTFERPWENFSTQLWTALRDRLFPQSTWNICLRILIALSPLHHRKCTKEHCSSVAYFSSAVAIFTTETSLWTCACASAT